MPAGSIPAMLLTDFQVRTAKRREKLYKLADGGWLYLYVTLAESKLSRMAYRFSDKEKALTLSAYPEMSLEHFPLLWSPVDRGKCDQEQESGAGDLMPHRHRLPCC